jgi:hypothetical protein
MLTFAIASLAAIALAAFASLLVRPRWPQLAPYLPVALLHRWSVGCVGLAALFVFFVGPFLLLGEWAVAAAGLLVATVIVALTCRDVIRWIVEDLRAHRADGRGPFEHSRECAGHAHARRH